MSDSSATPSVTVPTVVESTASVIPPGVGDWLADRYRLVRPLGEGGMGTVYEAEQTEPVRRPVAIKLIKPGHDSAGVLARFAAERQALAVLDHPHVAKVLDAGTAADGRPFFVMELVRGRPLAAYCDAVRLPVRRRLELFALVCAAVQHAHQKGIIHRDLKPSNVLVEEVDGTPVPKVIDFGLAKAVGEPLADALLTRSGEVMGTPLYMAPEQAGGSADVDTRADVYALGVMLYELLAGSTPVPRESVRGLPLSDVLRQVREVDPVPPSRRLAAADDATEIAAARGTDPRRLAAEVRGDLDWVALRALEKDRDRRYPTAAAVADEVRRVLANEPVSAGPPSVGYRVRKFVSRNRATVTAGGAVLLALVGGVTGTTLGLVEASAARQQAEGDRDTARRAEGRAEADRDAARAAETKAAAAAVAEADARRQVQEWLDELTTVFRELEPRVSGGRPLPDRMRSRLKRLAEKLAGDVPGDPLVLAQLRANLADTLVEIGQFGPARPLWEKALTDRTTRLGATDRRTVRTAAELGRAEMSDRDTAAAVARLKACDAVTATFGPTDPDALRVTAYLGGAEFIDGDPKAAIARLEPALPRFDATLGPTDALTLAARTTLISAYVTTGRYAEAERHIPAVLAAIADRRDVAVADALDATDVLAIAYYEARQFDKAVALFEQTLPVRERLAGAGDFKTRMSRRNLGTALLEIGRGAEAVAVLERTRADDIVADGPVSAAALIADNNLGRAYHEAGRFDDAIRLLTETHAAMAKQYGPAEPAVLTVLTNIGGVYDMTGRSWQAIPFYERALAGNRKALGPTHRDTLVVLSNLAAAYEKIGRYDAALAMFAECQAGMDKRDTPTGPYAMQVAGKHARALAAAGEPDRAVALYDELVRRRGQAKGSKPTDVAFEQVVAATYLMDARPAAAERWLREAVALRQKHLPADNWMIPSAKSLLGEALTRQGKYAEAETVLLAAHDGLKGAGPAAGSNPWLNTRRLAELYAAWGKPERAAEWRAKLPPETLRAPRAAK